jgi:recombination protein RecT
MSDQETVSAAVARQVPLEPVLEQMRPEFTKLLPSHLGPERYERWCVTFLKGALGGKQADAWRKVLTSPAGQLSVMQAFLDCGSLGLEPGRTYHLVPFGDQVTGITDYKGEIELIYRAGRTPVVAQLVREGDRFAMLGANVPPRHEADWLDPARCSAEIIGGYAYAQLTADCYSLVVLMSEADFVKHQAKARTKNVWDEWPEAMRLKTLVHQLRKWVPWSAEWVPSC